jgi:hypothetical protein
LNKSKNHDHKFIIIFIIIIIFSMIGIKKVLDTYNSCIQNEGILVQKAIGGYVCIKKEKV